MPPVVAVGVWLWFAISCVVWTRRVLRRFTTPRTRPATTAPTPAAPVVRDLPVPSRRGVADVLAGIELPCGLTPLTGPGADHGGGVVRFVTAAHETHEVAAAVGAELERLGLRFAPEGDGLGLATGERGTVRVDVRRVAEALKGRPDPEFPTAAPGSVVVAFALA
jgi:hypothetical protein